MGELPEATDTMVGQRGLFHGGEPGSRRAHIRWAFAVAAGASVSACSLVANLGQFDGAQLAAADLGPDAAEQPDSPDQSPEAAPDVTTMDVTTVGDMDAGMDSTTPGDDVVTTEDTSVDESSVVDDASLEDAGETSVGPVYVEDAGPGLDGGPCMPNWPTGGTNYVEQPDFEPGDPNVQADGGTQWFPVYGGAYTRVSTHAFCGSYSGELTMRGNFYHALGTNVPPDAGAVNVSAWAMQDGDAGMEMAIGGVCFTAGGTTQYANDTPTIVVAPNTWTQLTGTVTFQSSWGCAQSVVFVGQPQDATPPFNNIYVDEAYFGE